MKRAWALLFIVSTMLPAPFADSPKPGIEAQLRSIYAWTGFDGNTGEVTAPGVLLVVQRDGITTNPVAAPFNAQNSYKDGQLKRSALNFFTQEQATAGKFLAGDRVYVTKTEVKDNNAVLSLLSVDLFGGTRMKASVSFQFPKGFLATAGIERVTKVIGEVLLPEATPEPGATPAAPSRATVAQPAAETAAAPATIELGFSIDQVREILGEPEIIADLGNKQIFCYRDIKVTFLDGRVSDVK